MRALAVKVIAVVILIGWHASVPAQEKPANSPGLPGLSSEEAWKVLPRKLPALPAWARVLAGPLPKTTGTMLELDYLHRARNPLGPVLAAKLRWATANSLGSVYGQQTAEADLRRSGVGDDDLKKLTGKMKKLPAKEKAAILFARKMSRSAAAVTDEEMAELLKHFGPEQTVAIVHTLAYANFHNRIIMALGISVEPDGPLPPLDLQIDPVQRAKIITPKRPPLNEAAKSAPSLPGFRLDWGKQDADLTKALEQQKARKSRIPPPDASRLAKVPAAAKEQTEKIVWMNVSMGYQPQLAAAWFDCLRAFQSEAAFDRVFSNSVFWVITRSNECFY